MGHCGDSVRTVTLEGGPKSSTRISMWRIERSTLVVAAAKSVSPSKHTKAVNDAVALLLKLSRLTSDLHMNSR